MWPNSLVRLGGYIDIWWIVGSGDILLLLPHLLKKHRTWRECRARLWVLADKAADDPVKIQRELKQYVTEFRLDIDVHVKVVDPSVLDFGEELGGMAAFNRQASPGSMISEVDNYELRREMSGGSSKSKEELVEGMNRWIASHSGEEHVTKLTSREISREVSYLAEPPGSIGRTAVPARTLDDISFGIEEERTPARRKPRTADAPSTRAGRDLSGHLEDGVTRRESKASRRHQRFLHSKDQLHSTRPMSAEQLLIPRGLNQLIVSASKDAELVVTNLPDMSKTESAFGYFQFVAALTKDLPRVVLVRGTNTEVITAFT
jgi:hypothetical protein